MGAQPQLSGVSCIVPMASHVDHTDHDVQVIVTEYGLADIRHMAPGERARLIIEKCAHPLYRDSLMDYLRDAERRGGQTPHALAQALQDGSFRRRSLCR